jgi:hypothetical protein
MHTLYVCIIYRCWTQGKPDKLVYLRKAAMWYLTEECSPLESLVAPDKDERKSNVKQAGAIYKYVESHRKTLSIERQWDVLAGKCCTTMPGAP